MMIQKYKFVEQNIDILKTLTKNGYVSPKLLLYYDIYKAYISVKEKSRIKRYKIIADMKKSNLHTVRRAVADMKRYVRD